MKSKRIAKRDSIGNILDVAAELSAVQRQAEKLGMFTGSRDLLECAKCGLVEDVLSDGRLVTYYKGKKTNDTGLRFKRKRNGIYRCPRCGSKAGCC